MALSKEIWQKVRLDYEIHGIGNRELERKYGIGSSTIANKIKTEHWKQSKTEHLVAQKVDAEIALAKAEKETEQAKLSKAEKKAFEKEVQKRLDLEGIRSSFHANLYAKGEKILRSVETANEWKTMTSGAKDLMPQKEAVAVNVNQQAVVINPKAAMEQVLGQIDVTDV